MIEIDAIDRALLRALVEDAGQSAGALARVLGMSQPVIWRRIKRLRDTGVIKGTRLRLDKAALGFGVTVFLGIKLATKGRVSLDDFERAVTGIPEVQNVEHVLGLYDIGYGLWRAIYLISNVFYVAYHDLTGGW